MLAGIERNRNLQSLNTLAAPSEAAALARLQRPEAAAALLDWARCEGLPVIVLGEGSNVLLAERLEALVLVQASKGIDTVAESDRDIHLRVAAGENWHQFVNWSLARGYSGLENLALIPGTVGAAPVQNIGAYGVELAEYVVQVSGIRLRDGQPFRLSNQQCRFAYRDSVFRRALAGQLLIQSVELCLPRGHTPHCEYPALRHYLNRRAIARPSAREVFDAVVDIRRGKLPDPRQIPNAGSFFKNPSLAVADIERLRAAWPDMPAYPQADGTVRVAAAWLIEQCGFKGRRHEPVRVHGEHALVITNPLGRGGSEVAALAAEIITAVQSTFEITLQQEPRSYGWV